MLGVDTNVLVRFVTQDDPEQYRLASELFEGAGDDGLFANPVVFVELYWVLRRVQKMPHVDILSVLEGLLDSRELLVDRRDLVIEALDLAARLGVDFSDAVIGLLNRQFGCTATATFDKQALRLPQFKSVQDATA